MTLRYFIVGVIAFWCGFFVYSLVDVDEPWSFAVVAVAIGVTVVVAAAAIGFVFGLV